MGTVGSLLERVPSPVRRVLSHLIDHDILLAASGLAFYGLISALPLLLLSFAFVGAVMGDSALEQIQNAAIAPQFGSAGILVRDLIRGSQQASWFIALATLWPATAYGAGLRRALSHMSGSEKRASGLRGRLIGLGFVLVLPALVLLGVPGAYALTGLTGATGLATVLGWVVAIAAGTVMTAVLLVLIFRAFATEQLTWRATLIGSALTAAALAVLSLGCILVLGIGGVQTRYGSAAVSGTVLLGIWLLLANILVLTGYQTVVEITYGDE